MLYDLGALFMRPPVWAKQKTCGSQKHVAWGSYLDPTHPSIRNNHESIILMAKGSLEHPGDPDLVDVLPETFRAGTIT